MHTDLYYFPLSLSLSRPYKHTASVSTQFLRDVGIGVINDVLHLRPHIFCMRWKLRDWPVTRRVERIWSLQQYSHM